MNDPYGIVHADGKYHMFYQYLPGRIEWDAALSWGHAVSRDLVRWEEKAPALTPLADEVGCWSGSVVFDERGPVLFYTRPAQGEWGHGTVVSARARSGLDDWDRTEDGVLIDGPPPGEAGRVFIEFRDPNVRRDDGRWVMILGAGVKDEGGCVLQYSSHDLVSWSYDGVLARPPEPGATELDAGIIWECPQLIEVDGQWVLLISAEDWAGVSEVLYAIGDYDGQQFAARVWGRFGYSRMLYATTAFRDQDGRPCAVSWLRESGPQDHAPDGSPWAGAQSLVHQLGVIDDRLVVAQHPALAAELRPASAGSRGPSPITQFAVDGLSPWRISVDLDTGARAGLTVDVAGAEGSWALHADPADRHLRVATPQAVLLDAPMRAGSPSGGLDLVVDADIVEVTWSAGEGVYVTRVPAISDPHVTIRR